MRRLSLVVVVLWMLLSVMNSPDFANAGERNIVIKIHHSRFIPSTIKVPANSTVHFTIVNTDPIDHEFILGPRDVQLRHEKGTEAHHGAVDGEVSVAALSSSATTYHFSPKRTVPFGCHLPGHFRYGMRGVVEVRA